jgi:hypothetical protein
MSLRDEIAAARERGARPRVHQNGFLQLDLEPDQSRRLHIFDDALPRQSVRSSLHDHTFDMASTVVRGAIWNEHWDILPDRYQWNGEVYEPMGGVLVGTGQLVKAQLRGCSIVSAGQSYRFPAFEFHDSKHRGLTVTVMEKVREHGGRPRVLVPRGMLPDNDFHREAFDPEPLWELIEAAVA